MYRATQSYPGRSAEEIFDRLHSDLWGRRGEITHADLIDKILGAVKWERRKLWAGGSKRIMLIKSRVDLRVSGDTVTLELAIPFRDFERKYGERMKTILETLFSPPDGD
jgi:hypothetical protein